MIKFLKRVFAGKPKSKPQLHAPESHSNYDWHAKNCWCVIARGEIDDDGFLRFLCNLGQVNENANMKTLEGIVSDQWLGKNAVYKMPMEDVTDEDLFTHIALIATPGLALATDQPIRFGDNIVRGPFILMWWHEGRQEMVPCHCPKCAIATLRWIANMQEEWGGPVIDIEEGATHAAPARLQ